MEADEYSFLKNVIDENKSQQGKYLLHIIDREQYNVII